MSLHTSVVRSFVPLALTICCHCMSGNGLFAAEWQAATGPLATRWAAEVSPDNVWPEYPRPQMVRENWSNLNGLWDYAIRPRDARRPAEYDGQILVPFAVESALSGVMKPVGTANRLWYRRTVSVATPRRGERLLLHFGAVDWQMQAWVNGASVGTHTGGYDPFSFDITDAISSNGDGADEIVVGVWDPTNDGYQPRGKQVSEPQGIFYTAVTGIWQTVWLETVPASSIRQLQITPNFDQSAVEVTAFCASAQAGDEIVISTRGARDWEDHLLTFPDGQTAEASGEPGSTVRLKVPIVYRWSPTEPWLYPLRVELQRDGRVIDTVESYFGLRKIEIKQDVDGFNRLFLNSEPLFQFGPLDQGWWPDGLYTAATDAALRYDIEVTKRLGMNMCRKHVKVEPARWYYWCDKLGLMVWQDMPSGDKFIGRDDPDFPRTAESAENFYREWQAIIDANRNHPSIVVWVPFNEGWGQFDTDKVLSWTKRHDPTRLVDGPSGWADRGTGDLHDMHRYPGPAMPRPESGRVVVLGEFGGLGWPVPDHLWWNKRNWGYRTYQNQPQLQEHYDQLMLQLRPLIGRGLAAAVYTQTSDVEGEVNGLMTYDRALIKLDEQRVAKLHARFYEPPPIVEVTTILATSEETAQSWKYTTTDPGEKWFATTLDDSSWRSGPAGFGTPETPGSKVRTTWNTDTIWLRREFHIGQLPAQVQLRVHHDEDAEIYLNDVRVMTLSGYTTEYQDVDLPAEGWKALRTGKNVIAVHCRQTSGGQFIDLGLQAIRETPRPSR